MYEENLLEEDSHQRGFHRAGGWGGGGGVSRCAGRGGALSSSTYSLHCFCKKLFKKKKKTVLVS